GDPGVVCVHLVAVHDPLLGHDVVIQGVVAEARALPFVAESLSAANPEVEFGAAACDGVGWLEVAGVAPGVLGLRRSECGEHPGRRGRVGALNPERVVKDGTVGHCFSSRGESAWVAWISPVSWRSSAGWSPRLGPPGQPGSG